MVGAGGVIAVIMSAYFCRLPVLFWFMVAAFITSLAQAGSHGFMGFFVPRVLNGFFAGVAQGASQVLSVTIPVIHAYLRTRRFDVY